MHLRTPRILFPFLILLIFPETAPAQSINFDRIMGQATTRVNKTIPLELEGGTLKGIRSEEEIALDGATQAWRLVLTGWSMERGTTRDVIIGNALTILAHYGNRFEYLSVMPEIPGPVYDAVMAETVREQRDLVDEYDDVNVTFDRTGNQFTVNAVYEYRHGTGGERIENRLVHLMNRSRSLMMKILDEKQKKERDLAKEIENGRPTFVSADDMSLYFNWDVDEFRMDQTKTEHGGWRYTWDDIGMQVWNHGDHYELAALIQIYNYAGPEAIQTINDTALAWARDHMPRGATSVRTEQDYYNWTNQVLLFRYDFDGETKGEDHMEYIDRFQKDYLKEVTREMDDITSRLWVSPHDVNIPYLSSDVFIYLADDGLEDLHAPHESASEGWFEFNYNEVDYELWLYGDSLQYTIWFELPEDDGSKWAGWLDELKSWVRANPADGASRMDVLFYPGYENLLWIRAAYPIDGTYTGAELKRRYHAFVEEWTLTARDKARSIFVQ